MNTEDERDALDHQQELDEQEQYEKDMIEMHGNMDSWNEWCKLMDDWYESMEGNPYYGTDHEGADYD